MKKHAKILSVVLYTSFCLFVTGCNQAITAVEPNPNSINGIVSGFISPPVEYGMTFYWGWDGNVTEEVIARDLDNFKANNVRVVTLEPGYGMPFLYLSDEWFQAVKLTVELAKQRGMKVWLVDEGKYPSGFAGGKFTSDAPDLRMQALVVDKKFVGSIKGGDTVTKTLPDSTVGVVAINKNNNSNLILTSSSKELNWTAPDGDWEILVIEHQYRSSATRAVNNPTRKKDSSNSLCDYLNPEATMKFIEFTHDQYKKYVGHEFGKTVLGFRGDEPDYSIRGIPYTPKIFEEFKLRKGYDVRPYIAAFFAPKLTDVQQRVKADYWDVWSDLFSENFFAVQAKWCAENNLQYLVHLNKEDNYPGLVDHEGDFFKDMRSVQMPGVDAIWNQIWPGNLTDFPKYASSVAHVYGKPRAFTESFAAYKTEPNVQQAKWVLDHQFVRGINMVEVMFVPASSEGTTGMSGWLLDDEFPAVAEYINRMAYTLSQGKPAAKIAMYYPTTSMWLGDDDSDKSALDITKSLLENQRDFDYVDEYALCSVLKIKDDKLINLSGQAYETVIVPSVTVMSKQALDNLKAFRNAGGSVIFMGRTPSLVTETIFKDAIDAPDVSWAVLEPSGELTNKVLKALPAPDVFLDKPCADVKCLHRKFSDADLYMLFNESTENTFSGSVKLEGKGVVQLWDPMKGELVGGFDGVSSKINLELQPYSTVLIVIGQKPDKL